MPSQGWAVRFVERNKSTIDFGDTIEDSDRCIAWSTFDNYEAYFNVVAEYCVTAGISMVCSHHGPGLAIRKAFANHLARKAAAVEDKKASAAAKKAASKGKKKKRVTRTQPASASGASGSGDGGGGEGGSGAEQGGAGVVMMKSTSTSMPRIVTSHLSWTMGDVLLTRRW